MCELPMAEAIFYEIVPSHGSHDVFIVSVYNALVAICHVLMHCICLVVTCTLPFCRG